MSIFCWYQEAAENGHTEAQNSLALLYYNGEGTEKNLEKAFYWYHKTVENGHIDNYRMTGEFVEDGMQIGRYKIIRNCSFGKSFNLYKAYEVNKPKVHYMVKSNNINDT